MDNDLTLAEMRTIAERATPGSWKLWPRILTLLGRLATSETRGGGDRG